MLLSLAVALTTCCSTVRRVSISADSNVDPAADEVARLMRSVVQIDVQAIYLRDGERVDVGHYGSGFVVARNLVSSLVITAAHVSKKITTVEDDGETRLVDTYMMDVVRFDGERCPAKEIYSDHEGDVSIVKVDCDAGLAIELAPSLPPLGARIMMVGFPQGFKVDGSAIVTEGRFTGLVQRIFDRPFLSVSIPSSSGFSGAPVIYNGRVFSIMSRGHRGFDYISFGVDTPRLWTAYLKGLEQW